MTLIRNPRQFLQLDVSDKPGTGGTIKQRSCVRRIVLEWDDEAQLSIVQTCTRDLYAAENGGYGVRLTNVVTTDVELHGDNHSAVHPLTGVVLLNRFEFDPEETQQAFEARVESDEREMELQGDWLMKHVRSGQFTIAQMSLSQLDAANKPPYRKFDN